MYVSITSRPAEAVMVRFNDFTKSRRPYWNFVLEIERGPGPPNTSGYADVHRVQMYVSITSRPTEGVMIRFNDFTKSRRPYCNFVLEIERGPGPRSTSGYDDGHVVQMYVSITNTEGVMAILMTS